LRKVIEAHAAFCSNTPVTGMRRVRVADVRRGCCGAQQRGLELPVQMELAAGEVELRDGDYFGTC
jgi:hypothetical protein